MTKETVFSNATSGKELKDQLRAGFTEIANTLLAHCGPYASTAIIGAPGRNVDVMDTFTKDGISIARGLLSDKHPIARFGCRISRFLGTTTDKHCHDGTTTAMALFALLAKHYFALPDVDGVPVMVQRRREQKTMLKLSHALLDFIQKCVLTKADLLDMWKDEDDVTESDITKALAYQTALIASKGDTKLAYAIATVIEATPVEMFGLFVKTLARNELSDTVEVVEQPYQFEIEASLGADAMNVDMNQRFRVDRAVIFGATKALAEGSWEEEILYHMLGKDARSMAELSKWGLESWWDTHDGNTLIILSPQTNSMRLAQRIREFNDAHPNNRVVIATLQIDSAAIVPMTTCLYAMVGRPIPEFMEEQDTANALIHVGKVAYSTKSLQISGIYERTGEALHPMYLNPELNVHYTNARETLERLLSDHVKDPLLTNMSELVVNKCIYYYRFMTCQKIMDVRLGGLLHGNREMQSVYEDSMGSAISACRHGVVCDVFSKLWWQVSLPNSKDPTKARIQGVWRSALEELLCGIHQDKRLGFLRGAYDLSPFLDDTGAIVDLDTETTVVRGLKDNRKFLDLTATSPEVLIQPYMGAREQLRRIGDILPGVMNTSLFIDMGHVDDDSRHRNNQS